MLKNIRNLIFIFLILITCSVIRIFFFDYSATLPYILIIVVVLLNFIFYIIAVFMVKISIDEPVASIVECGDNVTVGININKKWIYPFKEIQTVLYYKSNYEENFENIKIKIELSDRIKQSQKIQIPVNLCGYMQVRLQSVVIFDMFSLFGIKRKISKSDVWLMVMPKAKPALLINENIERLSFDEEEVFFNATEENSRDIYEIREYIPGDSLKNIHWKLTAKSDDFMVKEFNEKNETNIYVYYDIRKGIDLNNMYEEAVSVSAGLIERNCKFYIMWLEFDLGKCKYVLKRKEIKDMSELYMGLSEIMKLSLYEESAETDDILRCIRRADGSLSTIFVL